MDNKVKKYEHIYLYIESEDVQIPEESLKFLKSELKFYEWPSRLKVTLNKVLKDITVAAQILLYMGLETNTEAWKLKDSVLNSKVDMQNVAMRINCNRKLLEYIGTNYGDLVNDKFWADIVDCDVIHKAKVNAQKKPADAYSSLTQIKKAIIEKGFEIEEVGLYSDSGREISSHYDINSGKGKKKTKVASIHTDERILRIFRKDGFSVTEFKLSCVNPAAIDLIGT